MEAALELTVAPELHEDHFIQQEAHEIQWLGRDRYIFCSFRHGQSLGIGGEHGEQYLRRKVVR